jgi:hypothetical protein
MEGLSPEEWKARVLNRLFLEQGKAATGPDRGGNHSAL